MPTPRRALDLTLTATIFAIAVGMLLARHDDLATQMEESAVQAEAAALRVELLDLASHREIWGGQFPAGKNPVKWASHAPLDYVGELAALPAERGIWFYDTGAEELVYLFRHGGEARFRLSARAENKLARGGIGEVGLIRIR